MERKKENTKLVKSINKRKRKKTESDEIIIFLCITFQDFDYSVEWRKKKVIL